MTFTDSDGKTYSYSEIANMEDSSELKFTSFKVELKNDISCDGANKLVFSYATTADLTQAVTGRRNNYVNRLMERRLKTLTTIHIVRVKLLRRMEIIKRNLLVQQLLVN